MARIRRTMAPALVLVVMGLVGLTRGHQVLAQAGGTPQLVIAGSTASIGFGRVLVNQTSVPQTITLQNGGTAALTVGGLSIAGTNPADFTVVRHTCQSVPVGAVCTVTLTFRPGANGPRGGRLLVANNGPATPSMIVLIGWGVNAAIPQRSVGPIDPQTGFPLAFSDGYVNVGSSRVDLQACKLEYSIVSPK